MRRVAGGLLALAIAVSAHGHETWMMPTLFTAQVGEPVRFDLSSGLAFPRLENAIKADRVETALFRLGPDFVELKNVKPGPKSLYMRQAFRKDGVATVRVDLKPNDIQLTDAEVAEYLDEIGATAEVRAIWAERKGRVPWNETYVKHAKTFVAVGNASKDLSWADGIGTTFELVPTTDPFEVRAGREFTVELLSNTKPIAGLPVGLMMEGASERVFRTTNADGRATFPVATAGRAMLFAVHLRLAHDGRSWRSDFCTMTIAVRP